MEFGSQAIGRLFFTYRHISAPLYCLSSCMHHIVTLSLTLILHILVCKQDTNELGVWITTTICNNPPTFIKKILLSYILIWWMGLVRWYLVWDNWPVCEGGVKYSLHLKYIQVIWLEGSSNITFQCLPQRHDTNNGHTKMEDSAFLAFNCDRTTEKVFTNKNMEDLSMWDSCI